MCFPGKSNFFFDIDCIGNRKKKPWYSLLTLNMRVGGAEKRAPKRRVGGAGGGGGAGEGERETLEEWGAAVVRMLTERRAKYDTVNLHQIPVWLSEMEGRKEIPARRRVRKSLDKLGFRTQDKQGVLSVSTGDRGGDRLQKYMSRSSS